MSDRETPINVHYSSEPYLSVVVTARNDDHGGNLLERMQAFVDGWIELARRYEIPSEMIVVEWNPPGDRPPLAEALRWPADFGGCRVRFIVVPPELHRRYRFAEALPLYQMIAKNVGIRRARGQFVLVTNIDILFSEELAAFLGARKLERGRMYRIDRCDSMNGVPGEAPIEEQLAYCRTHLVRVNRREGTFPVTLAGDPVLGTPDIAAEGSGILFGSGWFPVEHPGGGHPAFRWMGGFAELLIDAEPAGRFTLVAELEPGPGVSGVLEVSTGADELVTRLVLDRRSRVHLPLPSPPPACLRFRVFGSYTAATSDPRPLVLRVFGLSWEKAADRRAATSEPVVEPDWSGQATTMWRSLQHLVTRLAEGGPLVPLVIPVSPGIRRTLKTYVEWGGATGFLRNALPALKRRRILRRLKSPLRDTFAADSCIQPGSGWGPRESFRGESFHCLESSAEVIVEPAASLDGALALCVEPIPATAAATIALLDASGQVLARERLTGLSIVRFRVPRQPGRTQVFRLERGRDGSGPPELKVLWCGWLRSDGTCESSGFTPPWGAGWKREKPASWIACDAAELIVRQPPTPLHTLFLDLETEGLVNFEIRQPEGRPLATFSVKGRATHFLTLQLRPGGTQVLEIAGSGQFRAYSCGWANPNAEELAVPPTPEPHRLAPHFLHTNACGDFTLLAREHWFELRGYPEFDVFSMNLDSLFCFTAHYGGAREEVLQEPMRIYHIEHATGSGWTPEGQAKLFERIAAKGIPLLDNEEVLAMAAQMRRVGSPMIFNLKQWGLSAASLKETVLPGVGPDAQDV